MTENGDVSGVLPDGLLMTATARCCGSRPRQRPLLSNIYYPLQRGKEILYPVVLSLRHPFTS